MTEDAYRDADGNPVSLERLVRIEPDWAASRSRADRARIAELEAQLAEQAGLVRDAREMLLVVGQGRWDLHVDYTEVSDWLARTAPKEAT